MSKTTDYATKRRWQNRVRWTIAHHLNRLPWTCWANLVSWALHYRPLFDINGDDIRQNYLCRRGECGTCGPAASELEPAPCPPAEVHWRVRHLETGVTVPCRDQDEADAHVRESMSGAWVAEYSASEREAGK